MCDADIYTNLQCAENEKMYKAAVPICIASPHLSTPPIMTPNGLLINTHKVYSLHGFTYEAMPKSSSSYDHKTNGQYSDILQVRTPRFSSIVGKGQLSIFCCFINKIWLELSFILTR